MKKDYLDKSVWISLLQGKGKLDSCETSLLAAGRSSNVIGSKVLLNTTAMEELVGNFVLTHPVDIPCGRKT